MPCRDDQADFESAKQRDAEFNLMRASLCGVLTCIETAGQLNNLLDKTNWTEAGVSRQELEKMVG